MSNNEKFFAGVVALVILICAVSIWHSEHEALATLSPEERVRFEDFQLKMDQLQPGDLLTIGEPYNEEDLNLYMVDGRTSARCVVLLEGAPNHGYKETPGRINQHLHFSALFDAFKRVKGICKKDSEGWQELATFYYIQ